MDWMDICWEKADRQTAELFGDKDDLPLDESRVVFDDNLTHEEKLTKLKVIRAGKRIKPKSFAKRITRAGRISAQGLGIRLD